MNYHMKLQKDMNLVNIHQKHQRVIKQIQMINIVVFQSQVMEHIHIKQKKNI